MAWIEAYFDGFKIVSAWLLAQIALISYAGILHMHVDDVIVLFLVTMIWTRRQSLMVPSMENPIPIEFSHLKCSVLLADKRPNKVLFNRP